MVAMLTSFSAAMIAKPKMKMLATLATKIFGRNAIMPVINWLMGLDPNTSNASWSTKRTSV